MQNFLLSLILLPFLSLQTLKAQQPGMRVQDGDREDSCVVFSRFPTDPSLFREDVVPIAGRIIEKHGLKEWKIAVLTNEFHDHLGIYSILGAKMGLRVREYFDAGLDELFIVSGAGSQPPLSCMNDGLQVATGATLGHGTIIVAGKKDMPETEKAFPGERPSPMARFYYKDRAIEVSVKKEVREKIRMDVVHGVEKYGTETPEYWEYIRVLALQYWLELNRNEIFEIAEIPSERSR